MSSTSPSDTSVGHPRPEDDGRRGSRPGPLPPGRNTVPAAWPGPSPRRSVSPNFPSMTLAGLRSRCRTPRLWRVGHGLADVHEVGEHAPQRQGPLARVAIGCLGLVKPRDRRLQAVSANEPHRVIGPAVLVLSQPVDRDDPGVLQAAGHLGLEHEPLAVLGVVGMALEDLLEGDLAMQLLIVSPRRRRPARLPHAVGRSGTAPASSFGRAGDCAPRSLRLRPGATSSGRRPSSWAATTG